MNNSGGLGVSALRASTSNQLCYNTSVLSGYNALATCSSLSEFKDNIAPLTDATKLALRLKPVAYDSKTSGRPEIGLIAEDVAEVEPRLATFDGDGRLVGVDYGHVAAVALQAIRELDTRIRAMERGGKKQKK